ncbi:MAG: ABC transporter substrate-binding protein [Rhodospirillaceae bacterium]|nr:ABC transporter substrate-binding protein [Rhodospirillaceae bacterium]
MIRQIMKGLPIAAVALGISTGAALAGKANDTLTWVTDRESPVVDPYFNRTRELVIIGNTAWDGLLFRDLKSGDFVPNLAKSYKWVDNVTLDFELREGVKFHDGSSFGPEDVIYTVNFTTNKDNGVVTLKNTSWMKSVEKTGPMSIRIHLEKPFPAALAYLAQAVPILADGHYDNAPVTQDGKKDFGAVKPNGTGPYKITDIVPGEKIVMVRNDDYFDGSPKGKAAIKNLVYRTIKEMNTQMAELLTGGVDWIWDVPKDQAEKLKASGQVDVVNAKTMRISYLAFDVDGSSNVKAFKDKRVRQAFAHAINRESIVKNLVGEAAAVINTPCHPDQVGCVQDVSGYDYDPEKAKALLKEAGAEGLEFDIYAYRQREFTEAVISDLAKVGVKAKLNFMQYRKLRGLAQNGVTPVHHMTWGSYSIPDASACAGVFFSGGKDDPANDPKVNELINKAGNVTDLGERKALYKEAFQTISSEIYWLPMFTYAKNYAYNKDLSIETTSDEIPRFYTAKWK